MKFRKRVLIGSAFLALAGLAAALVDGALRYTGKVDDVHKFKFSGAFQLEGKDVKLTADVSAKVSKVDDAGLVTVQVVSTNRKMLFDSQDVPFSDSPALVKVFRPDGSLAELRGEGAWPEAYRLETLTSVKFADSALAADKTWTWEVPADTKSGVVKATVVFKVLGDEKIAGVDAWKISRVVKELAGDSPATDDGTVWIGKMDGTVVKQVDKWVNMPIHGATSAVSGTFTLELQP
jgi:hypothetical protein